MVRRAKLSDIFPIIELGKQAHAESAYSEICDVDEHAAGHFLGQVIAVDQEPRIGAIAAFVAEGKDGLDGVIVGTIQPLYQVLTAAILTNTMWYCRPGASPKAAIALLEALHEWAADYSDGPLLRRHFVTEAIIDPDRSAKLLTRRGYRLIGHIYEKE